MTTPINQARIKYVEDTIKYSNSDAIRTPLGQHLFRLYKYNTVVDGVGYTCIERYCPSYVNVIVENLEHEFVCHFKRDFVNDIERQRADLRQYLFPQ